MKRNMDLIRAIVLAIRDHEGRPGAAEVQSLVSNHENDVFGYHIALLVQSEMMSSVETGPRKDRFGVTNLALTWAGQNFADNILEDEVWASAQETLDDAKLESASLQVWSQITLAKITERLSGS